MRLNSEPTGIYTSAVHSLTGCSHSPMIERSAAIEKNKNKTKRCAPFGGTLVDGTNETLCVSSRSWRRSSTIFLFISRFQMFTVQSSSTVAEKHQGSPNGVYEIDVAFFLPPLFFLSRRLKPSICCLSRNSFTQLCFRFDSNAERRACSCCRVKTCE